METSIVSILIASAAFTLPRPGAPAGRDPGPPGLELIIGKAKRISRIGSSEFLICFLHHFWRTSCAAVFSGENAI
jgi:hypothetical protein